MRIRRNSLNGSHHSNKGSPQVFVVHGEEETSLAFSGMIKERYGFVTHVPSKGNEYEL